MLDAIIIGGGVTGLTAAYRRVTQGKSVRLIEASKPGGLIRTEEKEGFTLECGPNVFLDKPPLTSLLHELGLGDRITYPKYKIFRQHVWYENAPARVPKDPVTFFKSPLFAPEWKWPVLRNVLFGRVPSVSGNDCSIADFFRPFLGDHALGALLSPALKGIYGGSIHELSARTVLPGLFAAGKRGLRFREYLRERMKQHRARIFTIRGGMKTLSHALEAQCRDRGALVMARALSVKKIPEGFSVQCDDGCTLDARELVIATSGPASASYLSAMLPDLSALLDRVTHVPLVVVHVAVAADAPLLEKSFGVLFPKEEGRNLLGVMFNSLLFPHVAPDGEHLCTIMMGGSDNREILERSDEELRDIVAQELEKYLRIRLKRFLHLTRWERAIPQFFVGHHKLVEAMREAEQSYPGILFRGTDTGLPGVADRVDVAGS